MAKKEQPKKRPADEDLELEDEDQEDEDEDVEEDEEEVEEASDADEDEDKPAKKKKGGKGSGLVPREPVKVPKVVAEGQPKEVRILLKQREELLAKNDKKGLRKIRAALRKLGFRLSNLSGQPVPPTKKKAKAAVEDDEE